MSTLLGSGGIYGRDKNKRQLPCHSGLTITGWLVANEKKWKLQCYLGLVPRVAPVQLPMTVFVSSLCNQKDPRMSSVKSWLLSDLS